VGSVLKDKKVIGPWKRVTRSKKCKEKKYRWGAVRENWIMEPSSSNDKQRGNASGDSRLAKFSANGEGNISLERVVADGRRGIVLGDR